MYLSLMPFNEISTSRNEWTNLKFQDLPTEIVVKILEFLDVDSLLRVSEASLSVIFLFRIQ